MTRVYLDSGEIAFYDTQDRTANRAPAGATVADYWRHCSASDNPNAFIFLGAASAKHTASCRIQFREILVTPVVQPYRAAIRATGKGRNQREASEIFVSLRCATAPWTMLKAAGVSTS